MSQRVHNARRSNVTVARTTNTTLASAIAALDTLQRETGVRIQTPGKQRKQHRQQVRVRREGAEEEEAIPLQIDDNLNRVDVKSLYPALFSSQPIRSIPPASARIPPAQAVRVTRIPTQQEEQPPLHPSFDDDAENRPPQQTQQRHRGIVSFTQASPVRSHQATPDKPAMKGLPTAAAAEQQTPQAGSSKLFIMFQQIIQQNEQALLYNESASEASDRSPINRSGALETHRARRRSVSEAEASSSDESSDGAKDEAAASIDITIAAGSSVRSRSGSPVAAASASSSEARSNSSSPVRGVHSHSVSSSSSSSGSSSPSPRETLPFDTQTNDITANDTSLDSSITTSASNEASETMEETTTETTTTESTATIRTLRRQLIDWGSRYRAVTEQNRLLEQRLAELETELKDSRFTNVFSPQRTSNGSNSNEEKSASFEEVTTPGAPLTSSLHSHSQQRESYALLHGEQDFALEKLREENVQLQAALERLTHRAEELESLLRQQQHSSASMVDTDARILQLQRENELDKQQFTSLLRTATEQLNEVQQRHTELLQRFDQELSARTELQQKLQQEQRGQIKNAIENKKVVKGLKDRITQLEKELQTAKETLEQFRQESTLVLQQHDDHSTKQLEESQRRQSALLERIEQLESALQESTQLLQEVAREKGDDQERIEKLTQERDLLEKERNQLHSNTQHSTTQLTHLTHERDQLSHSLYAAQKQREEEYHSYTTSLSTAEIALERQQRLNQELQQQWEESQREVTRWKGEWNRVNNEHRPQERDRSERLQRELNHSLESNQQSQSEIHALRQEVQKLRASAAAATSLPIQAQAATEKLLHEQRLFYERKMDQWKAEYTEEVRREVRKEMDHEWTMKQASSTSSAAASAQSHQATLARVAELEQEVFIYRHQLDSSESTRHTLQKDLSTLGNERDQLAAQYEMLRAKFVSSTCLLERFERWFASKDRHMSEVARIIQDQTGGIFPAESIPPTPTPMNEQQSQQRPHSGSSSSSTQFDFPSHQPSAVRMNSTAPLIAHQHVGSRAPSQQHRSAAGDSRPQSSYNLAATTKLPPRPTSNAHVHAGTTTFKPPYPHVEPFERKR